ncbi:acylamino acid-releasing protein, partial [Bacillus paranthracis]|nr:acylamino acid-releasing protein [Bacillus paranthracis]
MKVSEKTYLSIEEIISLPAVSSTNISDDGKNVAFVKRTANWKDNTY